MLAIHFYSPIALCFDVNPFYQHHQRSDRISASDVGTYVTSPDLATPLKMVPAIVETVIQTCLLSLVVIRIV